MVEAWNAEHPDEQVTAQEIPAGRTSEEVIGAAITAGNAPCLVFNTAPAAVPQFERQGGLVNLDSFEDGAAYVAERSGERADQYRSADGGLYQMPWKANPVMIFYNRAVFEAAGLDADNPPLGTYDEFLATAQTLVDEGGVQAAIWPSPAGEFFQPWFDFYPLYAAQTGLQLVEDGEATFASEDGFAVAAFWRSLYDAGLSPREAYNGDAFGDGESAMAIVGPWAIAYYGDDVDWGVVPVPTAEATPAEEIQHVRRREVDRHVHRVREPGHGVGPAQVRDERGAGRRAARDHRTDADAHRRARHVRRLLRGEPRRTCRSPSRPTAPSRCRTCRTRSRCGRRSATRGRSR